MKFIIKTSLVTLLLLSLNSCVKDEPKSPHSCPAPLVIEFSSAIANQPLELQNGLYNDYLGRYYKVELLKFYLSNWALEKENGELIAIDQINLLDFSVEEMQKLETEIDTGTYVNLHFSVGLDSLTNSSDPADFENTHPLSIAQNTYWTWASKYKFFMLEGRIDTTGEEVPNQIFSYHTGDNASYREISIPLNNLYLDSTGDSLNLQLDLDKLINGDFGTIDFVSTPNSHSLDEISEKISNNLVSSFSIY